MEADLELIGKITRGAVKVVEENGAAVFRRFTDEQRDVYVANADHLLRTKANAGIRLEFATDAKSFGISGRVEAASSRKFCFFDVYVNGALVRHVGTHSMAEESEFGFEVKLPEGENRVAVYLPGLSKVFLTELKFNGAKKIVPVEKSRRLICYGDSITQGYDAHYPSLAYTNLITDALDAESVNKAIGGDRFNPPLAALPDAVKPDLITVAYGTNDWSHAGHEEMRDNAEFFFRNLTTSYPGVPVYAMLPLWRHDWMRVTDVGTFAEGAQIIRAAAGKYRNIKVIDGWELLPHLEECVSDGLHPNDFGFQFVARNILRHMEI
jgi:lysophospholipase L1-like esterase